MRLGRLLVVGSLAAAGLATAQRLAADPYARERLNRRRRVWQLTARRAGHLAVVRVRGARADAEARARLDEQYAIRTAEDVARELGNMKGAIMKAGQLMSFMAEGLPDEAKAVLATLQADVEPMAPSLAEQVVRDELGDDVDTLFLDWEPAPVAAASIGQVHRAVLHDGRRVAVKVQYPGIDRAIRGDLDNLESVLRVAAGVVMKGMDVRGIVDELRARMGDELDYRLEASCQTDFEQRYRLHPFIHVPAVVPERSSQRVLTSEWVDGKSFAEFEASADAAAKRHAAEVLFRFAQGAIHYHGVFNGDPHPGNYRFHDDGSVTFLDFGLVKRWRPGELEALSPVLDAVLVRDEQRTLDACVAAGFLTPDHGLDPHRAWEWCAAPYRAYLVDHYTFDNRYLTDSIAPMIDVNGPYRDVIRAFDMPPTFVILNRVIMGMSALLGRLGASGPYRAMLDEYRHGGPPATELGEQEAVWRTQPAS
ncbi:MAG: ABC1 kinase family protein [Acidimicrobiales bacterium]